MELWLTLQGADVPLEGALAGLAGLAWALWLWLSASVLLRLLVAAAGARAQGAAWVEGLRAFSDRVTLPVVRRVVDGAVVAGVVVQLAGRVPTVGAAGLDGPGIAPEATIAYADPAVASGAAPAAPEGQAVPDHALTTYRVRPGDSLWAIAMRFYGDGEGYPRIIEANVGRVMADGRPFTRSGVIQPGWELRVPLPERALGVTGTAEVTTYVVQPGDSLSGIAGRLWGRPEAWVDLFALNHGTARLADGRTLTRPELIWPGLQLTVPLPRGRPGQAVSFPSAPAAHAGDPRCRTRPPPDAPLVGRAPRMRSPVRRSAAARTARRSRRSRTPSPRRPARPRRLAQAPPGEAAPPEAPRRGAPGAPLRRPRLPARLRPGVRGAATAESRLRPRRRRRPLRMDAGAGGAAGPAGAADSAPH